jgi:hypothetical protein
MKTLIFNWRDELIRIKPEEIVYFEADGNYSKMMLVSKKQQLLSMNLSKVMAKLQEHLGQKAEGFEGSTENTKGETGNQTTYLC